MRRLTKSVVFAAVFVTLPVVSRAQADKTVTKEAAVTATATIQAIDSTTRSLTLRNEKGEEDTFSVGPDVKRFNELKVGDKINNDGLTNRWSSSCANRAPRRPRPLTQWLPAAPRRCRAVRLPTEQTRTVTVKAVDPNVPSITVTTPDGCTVTRMIEDKKNIEGVKAGDRIDITYTQALLVSAEPAK